METTQPGTVTQLLKALGRGDAEAGNQLGTILYDQLRQMAGNRLAAEPGWGDRQSMSLVHDAWIKLTAGERQFENRRHFFAAASRAMRQVLVDDARMRLRQKRNEGERPLPLIHDPVGRHMDPDELLSIHEALDRLAALDVRKAQVVEFRFFAGMTGEETAEALGVSARSIDSDWEFARAWLYRELQSRNS